MQEAVCGIVFVEECVLMVQRRDIPVWVLPGGGIDLGESPEKAVVREVWEETGFKTEIVRKIAEYQPVNRMTRVTHFYECRIISGEKQINEEAKGIEFFPLNALPELSPPPYAGWIKDAAARHPKLLRKKIEGVSYFVLIKLFLMHPMLTARYLLTKLGIHLNSS